MRFPATAYAFWAVCAIVGYLIGGGTGALAGLGVGLTLSLLASIGK